MKKECKHNSGVSDHLVLHVWLFMQQFSIKIMIHITEYIVNIYIIIFILII